MLVSINAVGKVCTYSNPTFLFVLRSRTRFALPKGCVSGIQGLELSHHAIGPAKAILHGYSPPPPLRPVWMTSYFSTSLPLSRYTASTLRIQRQAIVSASRSAVAAQTRDRDPLQRRPAVGRIPLLAGVQGRRHDAAGLEQMLARPCGPPLPPAPRRPCDEQRIERRRRDARDRLRAGSSDNRNRRPRRDPTDTGRSRRAAPLRAARIRARRLRPSVRSQPARMAFSRPNSRLLRSMGTISVVSIVERSPGIGEPARTEVPAALRRGADVAIHGARRTAAGARELHVLGVGFIAGRIAIIPIAIEDRAVRQRHHPPVRAAGGRVPRPLHPEGIFALELRQIAREARGRIGGRQQTRPSRRRTAAASG